MRTEGPGPHSENNNKEEPEKINGAIWAGLHQARPERRIHAAAAREL
jgi:hypothetical protein